MPFVPPPDLPFTLPAHLDARAADATLAARDAVIDGDRRLSWSAFRDESVRWANFLHRRLGPRDDARPAHVAMLLENHAELLTLFAGCAYAGATLFGVNTGLRGESLAGVIQQSRSRLLVVDEALLPEVERVRDRLGDIPDENLLVLADGDSALPSERNVLERIRDEVGAPGVSLDAPPVEVRPDDNLVVIYTSGTTGLPKGINNNHAKLLLIGMRLTGQLQLDTDAVGYACMPLFHSNALFLGFMPAFTAGGAISMRRRFSAREFVPDVLRYGASYWNYVGEPVHYILGALEERYGGDEERILAEVAGHPDNRLRFAVGNGAAAPDIDRFTRWLGLEDMFELYGSTEAAISTFRQRGDPRGCVGEVSDPAVRILDETGRECPPAEVDAEGRILNYAEAVGEICRVAEDASLFQGYFGNDQATSAKFRDGVYHSGDLGHVLLRDERRFLFFDGRTDDWIRKDGENFSAAQVARILQEHPDVVLAAAYGVPCPVSDEWVMAALKLRPGARFDPESFFAYCEEQVTHGGMDRKWFPDFVRIVAEFEYTQTQKILVRELKRVHFDRRRLSDAELYWRERGDRSFRAFSSTDYEKLRNDFEQRERAGLLET